MEGLNFPISSYEAELPVMMDTPAEQYIDMLRASGVTSNPVDPVKPLK